MSECRNIYEKKVQGLSKARTVLNAKIDFKNPPLNKSKIKTTKFTNIKIEV